MADLEDRFKGLTRNQVNQFYNDPDPTTFGIDKFKAEVRNGGLAKQNRFAVFFTYPASLESMSNVYDIATFSNGDDIRKTLLLVESVQLPGQSVATIQNRSYGEFREIPYEMLFEPITMQFYVDNNMRVKNLFDAWFAEIRNPVTRNFFYYDDYTTDIGILCYDLLNNETYRVQLYEAYPKQVAAIQLDQNNKEFMRLSVTFQYKHWSSTPHQYDAGVSQAVPSPGLLGFFRNNFDDFQSSFANFNSNIVPSAVSGNSAVRAIQGGGLPGFDGLQRDVQGFISGANDLLSSVQSKGIVNTLKGMF